MNLKNLALGAGLLLASTSASALNIVLTNDDGWHTQGIQAVYDALTEAGHTVILSAPLDGQSGSSAAFNIGSLEVTRQDDNQYSVALEGGQEGAEPASSGAMGVAIMQDTLGATPDLLVSGINSSANLAAATWTSGTVGAAIHSVGLVLGDSIPAIAISADDRCGDEEAEVTAECREIADFLVDYIDHLESRPNYVNGNSALVPNGRALNINYPPVEPQGVVVARQGQAPLLGGSLRSIDMGCDDCASLAIGDTTGAGIRGTTSREGLEDIANSDQALYSEGYITVVVIEPSYSANARGLKGYLEKFDY